MSSFRDVFLLFSQAPTASVMLNYVSGSTHYLSGGAFREERERDEKEEWRLYQLGAISDSESAAVITTE